MAPYWQNLGIEPTADIGAIKRAYARRLKTVRPDEDPAGFQELRAAYEYAINAANDEETTVMPAVVRAEADTSSDTGTRTDYGTRHAGAHGNTPPVADYRFQPQTAFADPRDVAQAAWKKFLIACSPLLDAHRQKPLKPLTSEVEQACQQLSALLRSPELEHLVAREAFYRLAIEYCAGDEAPSIVRVASLEVLRWEEERRASGAFTTGVAGLAFNRAIADRQYHFLLEKSQHSKAVTRLLEPGEPNIPWRNMYRNEFVSDMRKCLAHIRSDMPEVEHYRLGTPVIEAWIDAVSRPWPASIGIGISFAVGFMLMVICLGVLRDGGLLPATSFFASATGAYVIAGPLFLVPPALTLAYPRYWHPALRRMLTFLRTNRRVHLGTWMAHVVLTTFAFSLKGLPPVFTEWFAMLAVVLIGFDLLSKPNVNPAHLMFLAIMAAVIGMPMNNAFLPFAGEVAFLIPCLLSGLFLSLRSVTAGMYGKDFYRTKPRLILLLAGGVIWALHYFAPPSPIVALIGAIAGWWWILAVAAAADLLLLSALNTKLGGYLWLFGLIAMYYSPMAIQIDSPAAGMMHLQVSVGIALAISLMQVGIARLREK